MSTFTRQIDRVLAAQYGREAVVIGECGYYRAPSGLTVDIKALLSSAVKGTLSYPPTASISEASGGQHDTLIEVVNEEKLRDVHKFINPFQVFLMDRKVGPMIIVGGSFKD